MNKIVLNVFLLILHFFSPIHIFILIYVRNCFQGFFFLLFKLVIVSLHLISALHARVFCFRQLGWTGCSDNPLKHLALHSAGQGIK